MERMEIRPATWKVALVIVGMIIFVIVGLVMLVNSDSVVEKAIGVLCVVFFGGFGGYALYLKSRGQEAGKLAILPTGLEIDIVGMKPRVLPWRDIESTGVVKISNQDFTAVRLRNYRWLSGVTPEEDMAITRRSRSFLLVGYATAGVSIIDQLADPEKFLESSMKFLEGTHEETELLGLLKGAGKINSLVALLAYNRAKFGAELLFGWAMRDRDAQAFADFLMQCQHNSR